MRKGAKLAALMEKHGDTLLSCEGCEICDELKETASKKTQKAEKYRNILDKGESLKLSEVKFLVERGVDILVIRQRMKLEHKDFEQLLKAIGLHKRKKINTDIKLIKTLKDSGLSWREIAKKLEMSEQTLRKIRKSEGWVKINYSKEKQLYEKKLPSTRKRNEFTPDTRESIIDEWGESCYVCGDPRIQLHHVKFRSACGRGVKRNGLPLCIKHHEYIHSNKKFRKEITEIFIEKFGEDYYKDEIDLYYERKIKEPTKELLELYFLKGGR